MLRDVITRLTVLFLYLKILNKNVYINQTLNKNSTKIDIYYFSFTLCS